ncbi:hypothetical protein EIN_405290 [Entamoeba invadens IP1]|uniref:DNA-directed RNA polymerase III subunit RPC6 n=1 Tax=Entamoeba invadens IP1 TaxID=370355 RepID=A0A0A1U716_ENTIV|nr:hypothetical protein EIN_405290 [Entamoeba invadens IP1]ELP90115.1 hypothetical protein EIN_405290 [Entamoeba invadens IP1]|eukprot:XP_004256886.1 hypothetical protein EIN_405290 [Entamoeba invadens IP1]
MKKSTKIARIPKAGRPRKTEEKKNIFYTKTGLDGDFVDTISDHCYMFLLNKGGASVNDVYEYVRESGISTVDIKKEEILSLLNRLVFNGSAECSVVKSTNGSLYTSKIFKPSKMVAQTNPLSLVPCGNCPFLSICSPQNVSCNPRNCKYFSELLTFDVEELSPALSQSN